MSTSIKIPSLGESIKEARILRWIKQDGEYVNADEPVVEIETDKASDNIPAPAAGIVRVTAQADQVVDVGATIGSIEPAEPPPVSREAPPSAKETPNTKETGVPILSPSTQRMVAERGIDPSTIAGTGRDRRIIKEDVIGAKATSEPIPDTRYPTPAPKERETRSKMSGIRQRIAERLVQSQRTTATLTTFNEVDMSAIVELRQRFKDKLK